jgi:peroxiredoxin/predicted 2-oxoglutarate/Fe(II)-dependent dioxygenase YbiX
MVTSAETARSYANLTAGDLAPAFAQRTHSTPRFNFDNAAGRYLVLCFFASAQDPVGKATIEAVMANADRFDDHRVAFFGVSIDPRDEQHGAVRERIPGIRYFWDFDGAVGRLYGALPRDGDPRAGSVPVRRFWLVLNPTLRVRHVIPFKPDGSDRTDLFAIVAGLPPPQLFSGIELQAPILYLPDVFDPALCQRLIALYQAAGGTESGFMREVDGKTVEVHDPQHKRRKDWTIDDAQLIKHVQQCVSRRIAPELEKAYHFKATRMERYIVSCYSAADGGHFRAHRDNTTRGTAHRRFAVSINLNDAFEGGELSFPEYGPRAFKPAPGAAVVFSCSLLHAVSQVTDGERYAFLPFVYDEAAAKVREQNNAFLGEGVAPYKA